MKDPKDTIRDLKNAGKIRPRVNYHRDGTSDYSLTTGQWGFVWRTMGAARDVIEYLLKERDSLLDLLEAQNAESDG